MKPCSIKKDKAKAKKIARIIKDCGYGPVIEDINVEEY